MLKSDCLLQLELKYNKQCLILPGAKNAFLVTQPLQIWLLTVQQDWISQAEFGKASVIIWITQVTDGGAIPSGHIWVQLET